MNGKLDEVQTQTSSQEWVPGWEQVGQVVGRYVGGALDSSYFSTSQKACPEPKRKHFSQLTTLKSNIPWWSWTSLKLKSVTTARPSGRWHQMEGEGCSHFSVTPGDHYVFCRRDFTLSDLFCFKLWSIPVWADRFWERCVVPAVTWRWQHCATYLFAEWS